MASSDLVATWDVKLPDGVHKIEFEHGTTTGKRVIWVNGKKIYEDKWMFKLVGKEHFKIGKTNCTISIDAVSGFAYEYLLEVNGKPLKKFNENQAKIQKVWHYIPPQSQESTDFRICLAKDTLDVYVNDDKLQTVGEFGDEGTEIHFTVGQHSAVIRNTSTGRKRDGIQHTLFIDEMEIPEFREFK